MWFDYRLRLRLWLQLCLGLLAYACLATLACAVSLATASAQTLGSPSISQGTSPGISQGIAPQASTLPMPTLESTPLESNLAQNSFFTHRYTTRFDKQHQIQAMGVYGEGKIGANLSRYAGGAILYDGIIDRYPLGAFLGYVYEQAPSIAPAQTQMLALGVFSDVLLQAHHLQAFIAQGFQASSPLNAQHLRLNASDLVFASSSNAVLVYGYVFVLNSAGSFIEPYARYNLHFLFPISTQDVAMSSYMLRTNLDIGVRFKQFIGRRFIISLAPSFRQDIGVIGVDNLARPLMLDPNGEIIIALPDSKYHSYGVASLGLEWRAWDTCTIALKAHGIYTNTMYLYSGNLGISLLF